MKNYLRTCAELCVPFEEACGIMGTLESWRWREVETEKSVDQPKLRLLLKNSLCLAE